MKIDLNGTWNFSLDLNNDQNWIHKDTSLPSDMIQIPGSIEEQGYGQASAHFPIGTWKKDREYEGIAWYVKDIELSKDINESDLYLDLKGVRWVTELWIDGNYVGKEDSLSTVQRYNITPFVKIGGKHRFVIRIDNQMLLPLQESHIHSYHTSTYWGGITGGIQIISELPHTIQDVRVQTKAEDKFVQVEVKVDRTNCPDRNNWSIRTNILDQDGGLVQSKEVDIAGKNEALQLTNFIQIKLDDTAKVWSPDDPYLYHAEVTLLHHGKQYDKKTVRFGLRTISTDKNQILLNGIPIFLTGYVDCCIFPNTGYPEWDIEHYRKQFQIVKSYGFNHVRLHGWTPPEPFWQAADEAGMLVQTELPHWSRQYTRSKDLAPEEVHSFLTQELKRVLTALQNHPSFVMLSMGNELISEEGHPQLNELVQLARQLDASRIYTDNTGHGQLPSQSREGDFFIPTLNWHPPYNIDHAATSDTTTDYGEVTRLEKSPIIAHEHGQFTMYVRPEEEKKYQGVLKPYWLKTITDTLESKKINSRTNEFIESTGIHLVRSLKENMEKARRTPNLSGIQLLDIRDFPGQGHATVGILDVFWDSKNVVEPKQFRQFNEQTVLLMRSKKRTYYSDEQIAVSLELSHFGLSADSADLEWSLKTEEKIWKKEGVTIKRIPGTGLINLLNISEEIYTNKAEKITLEASITINAKTYTNEWDFWLFPRQELPENCERIWTNIPEVRSALYGVRLENTIGLDELSFKAEKDVELAITDQIGRDILQFLVDGGNVWLMAKEDGQHDEVLTRYLPIFWNYLWFPEQTGTTMGMRIHKHPIFDEFPHDGHSDWQWYHLVDRMIALNLDLTPNVKPIIEVIDNFNRAKKLAYVYEVNVGKGSLFVSTLNLTDRKLMKHPESHFLFFKIIEYLKSSKFQPEMSISIGELLSTFKVKSLFNLRY
ncbi:glycoside hydrolase family 2 protein [Gracilibacillus alcaliphilus]|uniref:glycoside hydrolase family 2 protein n=1 Tax=Gracilibacillus alcaliphilus TaxID=1401441 RepID=UPI001EF7AFF6|nr:sugar-binding domain-containing protein [Gracilibacillus alcaliphilus]